MKALKIIGWLPLLALALLTSCAQMNSSVIAQADVAHNDHNAMAKYYENQVKEVKIRLQANQKVLEECEAHPYYYGRQGQDVRSHASANIREYQKTLKESLRNAEQHRIMAIEQEQQTNKTKAHLNHDLTIEPSESSGREL
ncbi:MAG TPA: hypothetical protein PKY67_03515 [Nitrosomonas sp.]|jgi:hypothetical protein|nr:hypothetical protein [Nitrosomonas sp.]HQV88267.1 hypothetical protein [Nitrosomonas sp.]HRB96763.1 hypothetical protein [Nitrosomonas sp.]